MPQRACQSLRSGWSARIAQRLNNCLMLDNGRRIANRRSFGIKFSYSSGSVEIVTGANQASALYQERLTLGLLLLLQQRTALCSACPRW